MKILSRSKGNFYIRYNEDLLANQLNETYMAIN